jgi:hypothetical protein
MPVSSAGLAVAGTPFSALKALITVSAPASIAALKGGRKVSRSSAGGMSVES